MNSTDTKPGRHVAPAGMAARVFLAFLATAGFFYVNLMPAIVDGLIEGLGFTNQQAGAVGSANIYGAAFGALAIVFVVRRLRWKTAATVLLGLLIGIDLASLAVTEPTTLTALRFGHGFVGGMLIGTAFAVIARTEQPDRTFGVLLFVQFGLGGLGVMFLPGLVPVLGTPVLFLSLVAFSGVTLAMLPFLPPYPVAIPGATDAPAPRIPRVPLTLTLAALFLFQAANMGLYAYIIGLGTHYGLERTFITTALGFSAWLGLAGAGLVIVFANRLGYTRSLVAGIGVTILATAALLRSDIPALFFAVNALIGITWAFTIPYLLGLAARFDKTGTMAALGGFASKMGLASGPAVAAGLLGDNRYALLIWTACGALLLCQAVVLIPARLIDARHSD
ncbi:MFS transporter [Elongatibacter sediminis]|uniref:MFS transporter n=1 Tax=Elongatibacter sediminis TaxID=3119006 RepID=A0AAW9RBB8_9GAMM